MTVQVKLIVISIFHIWSFANIPTDSINSAENSSTQIARRKIGCAEVSLSRYRSRAEVLYNPVWRLTYPQDGAIQSRHDPLFFILAPHYKVISVSFESCSLTLCCRMTTSTIWTITNCDSPPKPAPRHVDVWNVYINCFVSSAIQSHLHTRWLGKKINKKIFSLAIRPNNGWIEQSGVWWNTNEDVWSFSLRAEETRILINEKRLWRKKFFFLPSEKFPAIILVEAQFPSLVLFTFNCCGKL